MRRELSKHRLEGKKTDIQKYNHNAFSLNIQNSNIQGVILAIEGKGVTKVTNFTVPTQQTARLVLLLAGEVV